MTLHITNGDGVADMLREGGFGDDAILPWRDVLHIGPLQAGISLARQGQSRAAFLKSCFTGPGMPPEMEERDVAAEFRDRDRLLSALGADEEVVLWFEHDLYDQLQLVQILDFFTRERPAQPVSLICIGHYPGVEFFDGLGNLTPAQLAALHPERKPVSRAAFDLAQRAWAALGAETPSDLQDLLATDLSALPFLEAALLRFCRDFPWVSDGLTLTERRLLQVMQSPPAELPRQKAMLPAERYRKFLTRTGSFPLIFCGYMHLEEAPFLGDLVAKRMLDDLCGGEEPLLVATGLDTEMPLSPETGYALTAAGEAVLAGQRDRLDCQDFTGWRGGVDLNGAMPWRWDDAANAFRQ